MEMAQSDPPSTPQPASLLAWMPDEGEPVAVIDYPSPHPLGVVEIIERDASGAAIRYWIWMLDGCRIPLEADTAPWRLRRP